MISTTCIRGLLTAINGFCTIVSSILLPAIICSPGMVIILFKAIKVFPFNSIGKKVTPGHSAYGHLAKKNPHSI